jgi:hypothetical protein
MLIEGFFEAVERTFTKEALRIPAPVSSGTTNGTTAKTTRNLANLTNQEQWMGLCELASHEQDQDKLGVLFEGILRLLEDQQGRLNTAAEHDTSAFISQ